MAMTSRYTVISSKMDILVKQRNNLQTFVDEISEVLQLTTSWLENADGSNNFTYTEINKMIEDKLVLLINIDFSVGSVKATEQQESAAERSSQPTTTSTDKPMAARHGHVDDASNEIKTIMNHVRVIQDAISFLSTNLEKLSDKQLAMEKFVESLSEKYSQIEQEKIRETVGELKSISEQHKKVEKQQEERMTNFEKKVQTVIDSKSIIDKNWQIQHSEMDNIKKEMERLQKQPHQLSQDLNYILENFQELNTRISVLGNQTIINSQIKSLENKIEAVRASSKHLSTKFEEQGSSFEEFAKKTEKTLKDLSCVQESEFDKLQKLGEKISALEKSKSETSQQNEKLCQDVKMKYEMVCQVVADRLVPLERLRDIFNEKLGVRNEHMEKLNSVCNQMDVFLPKFFQLEMRTQRQAIGFSASPPLIMRLAVTRGPIIFPRVIFDTGTHFDAKTGQFTAPVDGLYAVSLSTYFEGNGGLEIGIVKIPYNNTRLHNYVCGIVKTNNSNNHGSMLVLIEACNVEI